MGTFALLQTDIAPPTLAQTRDAIATALTRCQLPIVPMDAGGIVRDAFGVLVKRLDAKQADALRLGFEKAGYAAAVVAEDQLLDLPPIKGTRQLIPADDVLQYADALGRLSPIAWDQVLVMIAGVVVRTQLQRTVTTTFDDYMQVGTNIAANMITGRASVGMSMPVVHIETKEIKQNVPQMQLLLGCEPWRLNVTGTGLNYAYLANRRTQNSAKNFVLVLNDIIARAQLAVLSRGIRAMAGHDDVVPVYPTRGAFDEELCWLAWKAAQA